MAKIQTLADFLGYQDAPSVSVDSAVDFKVQTAQQFAEMVLSSKEFRQYISTMLTLGELPAAVVCRLMDYAWGKPKDTLELTGDRPLVSRVEVVVISAKPQDDDPRAVTVN